MIDLRENEISVAQSFGASIYFGKAPAIIILLPSCDGRAKLTFGWIAGIVLPISSFKLAYKSTAHCRDAR